MGSQSKAIASAIASLAGIAVSLGFLSPQLAAVISGELATSIGVIVAMAITYAGTWFAPKNKD